jgi:leucyl/phenylalanyl-tRNA--protein transferase
VAVVELGKEFRFPPQHLANTEGLLAYGGDLKFERLMAAYHQGVFPWYSDETPILWWCPDPRFVLYPERLKVSKSMRQILRRNQFEITFDTSFREVITACQQTPRADQDGTWITNELLEAYVECHERGVAHSVEVWQNGNLVGGLYGLSIGKMYFGESMFSRVSNASKAGFVHLVRHMAARGIEMIDCQVYTKHLESLGAELIPRNRFLAQLEVLLDFDTQMGSWTNWNS